MRPSRGVGEGTVPWTAPNDRFEADDGTVLHLRRALPAGPVRAHLVVVHGFAEHAGRYGALASEFARHGVAVHAPDLRGHGRSPGRPALVHRAARWVRDVDLLIRRISRDGRPTFAFGHSFGGALVARVLQCREDAAHGVILSAPYLRTALPDPAWVWALAGAASRAFPTVRTRALDPEAVSSLPEEVRRYRDDPANDHGGVRLASARELRTLGARVLREASRLVVPTLIVHGQEDPLADPAGSRALAREAGGPVELKQLRGVRHEALHDRGAHGTIRTMLAWVDARLAEA